MALSGTLKDFALPDIFQLIGMQRKTGLLTLESDRETVSVIFEQGMVVHSDSTIRRLFRVLSILAPGSASFLRTRATSIGKI